MHSITVNTFFLLHRKMSAVKSDDRPGQGGWRMVVRPHSEIVDSLAAMQKGSGRTRTSHLGSQRGDMFTIGL